MACPSDEDADVHAGTRSFTDKLRRMRGVSDRAGVEQGPDPRSYLNLASFRGETQGVGAAARAPFGKAPDALARDDALLLAALLPG